jgi:hypothetical protein
VLDDERASGATEVIATKDDFGSDQTSAVSMFILGPFLKNRPNLEDAKMLSLRSVLAATAVTFALGVPAFAQNISMELSDRQAMMIDTAGHVSRMNVGPRGHAMLMKHATRVQAGSIFYMSNGHLYMTHDRKMEGGEMLHELLVRAL